MTGLQILYVPDGLTASCYSSIQGVRVQCRCLLQLVTGEAKSRNLAPYLHNSSPGVWVCCCSGAVWAHVRLHHILNHKGLLQYGAIEHLTLDCQLCFESTRVRLCPDESCIHQLDLHTAAVGENVQASRLQSCWWLTMHQGKHDSALIRVTPSYLQRRCLTMRSSE